MSRTFIETVRQVTEPEVKTVLSDLLWLYLSYELIHLASGLLEVSQHIL